MKNKTLFESIKCAAVGIGKGFKSEKNFKIYAVIAIIFLAADFYVGAAMWEYCVFTILAAAVFSLEFVNTAIEKMADIIDEKYNHAVADIKDIAAAAVLISGIAFFITQAMIIIPKL